MRRRTDSSHAALRDKVVVITGASSGIGRAAALRFARHGCRVALAARRAASLHEVEKCCDSLGGSTHVVVTDMTRSADIERLVDETLARWGRIDIWVNNAGITLFARLEDGEFEAHRQVLETNLVGAMYAARLVIPVFRRQRTGTLINVGSVLSQVGQAFVPSYVVSKFGLQGLTEALRTEFADDEEIHFCTVLPYATDTPHFEDAGNQIGRRAHAMPPVQDPERVAAAIVDVAARPRRQRYVPRYVALGVMLHWLAPNVTERLLLHALNKFHLVSAQPHTRGNLFGPTSSKASVRGVRGPVVGCLAFAAWAAVDLLRIGRTRLRPRKPPPAVAPASSTP
jgi:NAD(P)-dependent dehydrogenase (short-subunit alcohol dehydrogenase family)